jgi:hypothetical protein
MQRYRVWKSPIQFEKRVYLPKPALNLLKSWFSREKPAEVSSKPGFCETGWFMKVWTRDINLVHRQKPTKNRH